MSLSDNTYCMHSTSTADQLAMKFELNVGQLNIFTILTITIELI